MALRFWRDGRTVTWTWNDWAVQVSRFAEHLINLGVSAGDRVVILSRNRPEWVVADLAIMLVGAVSVPIYPATRARHCRWTLRHADAHWIVVEDPVQFEKLIELPEELDSLKGVILIEDHCQLERPDRKGRVEVRFDELDVPTSLAAKLSRYADAVHPSSVSVPVEPLRARAAPDGLASIVYTSGTTGAPRGAMLSHRSFVVEVLGNAEAMPIRDSDRQILLLPLSQIFARILYMTAIYLGAETSFSNGFSHLLAEFQREKPTFFVGVPSVFERLSARFAIEAGGGNRLMRSKGLRKLARSAQLKSRELQGHGSMKLIDRVMFEIGDRTIFRQMRQVFGGRLRFAICGGASLSSNVCEIFHGAGIPVLEGYGLTESCGAATVNRPESLVPGTVGQPLPGVEVQLDESGQILLRGDSIANGYWNAPEATEANFVDGWFRTGDLGEFVDHRNQSLNSRTYQPGAYLKIHERIDDTILLKDGTKISPQRVESMLQSVPLIRNAVVTSTTGHSLAALLTLDSQMLRTWSHQQGRGQERFEQLCVDPDVYEWVKQEVESVNSVLKPSESVQKFAILPLAFSPESGEMTHTFKVRRRFVIDKYRSVLERMEQRSAH